jgi:hypothetical protein
MTGPLPDFVQRALAELSNGSATLSIWLVGSRANGTATESSDWDLLVFSEAEPQERSRRCDELDVIHVGPSGLFLAEGQRAAEYTLSFSNWEWKEQGDQATYTGCDLPDGATGRNAEGTPFNRPQRQAKRVWLRSPA